MLVLRTSSRTARKRRLVLRLWAQGAASLMELKDGYTLVYLPDGAKVSHVLAPNFSPNAPDPAVCGRSPIHAGWFGTGDEDEYDEARRRRMCLFCAAALRRQGH